MDGLCSSMVMLPERRMGVVVLSNGHDHPVCNLLANTVFDRLCGLDGINWFQRLAGARDRAEAERRQHRASWIEDRKPNTAPSHPLEDYAGNYAHPAYGTVSVTLVEGQLKWQGVGVASKLTHWHFDVFMTDMDAALWIAGWAVTFGYDSRGVVNRLMVQLEPALPDIVFARAPARAG